MYQDERGLSGCFARGVAGRFKRWIWSIEAEFPTLAGKIRRVERIPGSSRSAIGGKDSPNGALKPGEYVTTIEVVLRFQNFDLLRRPVDVDHAGFRFHQPEQARSGCEVLGDLDVNVAEAV